MRTGYAVGVIYAQYCQHKMVLTRKFKQNDDKFEMLLKTLNKRNIFAYEYIVCDIFRQ